MKMSVKVSVSFTAAVNETDTFAVLHENDLAALYVGELVKKIRSEGWELISPTKAYTDPISEIEPDTLVNNNGRIAAIAHATDYPGPKFDPLQPTKAVDRYFKDHQVVESTNRPLQSILRVVSQGSKYLLDSSRK